MKQKTHAKDTTMLFESTMVLFFGDKAYQTAGQASTPKYRSQWIKRVLKFVMKAADRIETTPRHKQLLMANAENVYGLLAMLTNTHLGNWSMCSLPSLVGY